MLFTSRSYVYCHVDNDAGKRITTSLRDRRMAVYEKTGSITEKQIASATRVRHLRLISCCSKTDNVRQLSHRPLRCICLSNESFISFKLLRRKLYFAISVLRAVACWFYRDNNFA